MPILRTLARPGLLLALLAPLAARAAPRVVTLEAAEQAARERQPLLRAARAGTTAAQARADLGRAGYFPQLTASAGYQRATGNSILRPSNVPAAISGATVNNTFDTYNSWTGALSATQLIWDFGQTSGRAGAAEASAEAAARSELATGQAVLFAVRSAFFDARAAKDLVEVAREALDNQRKHREQIEEFVKAGTRPDIDLAQARTDEANAAVALVNAENASETARQILNQAMGVEGSTDYVVADDAPPEVKGEDQPLEPLLDEAVKARPELQALEEQARAQRETLRSVEGQYGPAISASAGFTQGGTSLDKLGWNLSAGVGLSWQLFQGGATKAQVREAEANLAAIAAQADGQRQQIRADVDAGRLAVRAAKSGRGAAKDALANARDRLRLAEGRYQTGVGSVIELGDAQLALTSAEAQSVQADYKLATARALLLRALGRP